MRLTTFAIKNLSRRPGRTAFSAVGIGLAIATYTAMTVLFGGVADKWKSSLDDAGIHALIVQEMQIDWLASSVPQTVAADIAALPEILSAQGELLSFLTTKDGIAVLVSGWATGAPAWSALDFVAGAPVQTDSTNVGAIGEHLAEALALGVGDRLDLDGLAINITGVFRSGDPLVGGRVVMPLKTLQELMFREDSVTVVQVIFRDPGDPSAMAMLERHIQTRYPGLAVRPTAQLDRDNRMIDLLNVLRNVVVWIVGLVGLAGTANIMLMAVNERRSEIGLLVAVGWTPRLVIGLFLLEAVILASASGLLGIGAGLAVIEAVRSSATLAAFLSDPVSWTVVLKAFCLAVGIGAAGGILPAIRVLRIPADEALRAI